MRELGGAVERQTERVSREDGRNGERAILTMLALGLGIGTFDCDDLADRVGDEKGAGRAGCR